MSRLTLRLPESLHNQLEDLAKREGISLNQYIVYTLTRQITPTYIVHENHGEVLAEQRAQYETILKNLGHGSSDEIDALLAERETVAPESDLDPEATARVQALIDASKRAE